MNLATYILESHPAYATDEGPEADALKLIEDLDRRVRYLEERERAILEAKAQAISPKTGDILLLRGVDDPVLQNEWFEGLRKLTTEGKLPHVVAAVLPSGMELEQIPIEAREKFIANLQGMRS